VFAIAVQFHGGGSCDCKSDKAYTNPEQTYRGFLRKGILADRDALLRAKEGRFAFGFEIKETRIVLPLPLGDFRSRRVQFFLDEGRARLPRQE